MMMSWETSLDVWDMNSDRTDQCRTLYISEGTSILLYQCYHPPNTTTPQCSPPNTTTLNAPPPNALPNHEYGLGCLAHSQKKCGRSGAENTLFGVELQHWDWKTDQLKWRTRSCLFQWQQNDIPHQIHTTVQLQQRWKEATKSGSQQLFKKTKRCWITKKWDARLPWKQNLYSWVLDKQY